MDPTLLGGLLVAGSTVIWGFVKLRPERDSIIAGASEHAVGVIHQSLARLEEEMQDCHTRINDLEAVQADLEAQLAAEMVRGDRAERQLAALSAEVTRLGGDPVHILRDVR